MDFGWRLKFGKSDAMKSREPPFPFFFCAMSTLRRNTIDVRSWYLYFDITLKAGICFWPEAKTGRH